MTSEPSAPQRDAPLEITDAPRALKRHPSDLQRLMIALFVGLIGFLLATYLNTIGEAFTVEVINGVGAVFLTGQALGQAAMTALGLEAFIAVPTVFLYRIATFWLPILPGFLALRKLESDGAL